MEERQHILNILLKVKKALEHDDYIRIKNLSNRLVHHASIHQNHDVITTAVIIYSLSKLIESEKNKNEKNWKKFYSDFRGNINDMIIALKNKNEEKFHDEIISNRKLIEGLTGNLKDSIKEVFEKAKINKASRIYEHGISMEKTASILGVSLWDLSVYTGKTNTHNVNLGVTIPINKRIKFAEEIFRSKKQWATTP